MGARFRCLIVPLAALLLAALPLQAQDNGPGGWAPSGSPPADVPLPPSQSLPPGSSQPVGQPQAVGQSQPVGEPAPVGEPCVKVPSGHSFYFQADWLWTPRVSMSCSTPNFIDGPDAASFGDLPASSGESGYRLQGGARWKSWIVEGADSNYGAWGSSLNRNIDGVGFNTNALAGAWAGENSINGNTYFTPIVNAANLTSPANTAGDQSGLGPCIGFATDGRPALMANSQSDFYMAKVNVKNSDYFFSLLGHEVRLGAGYVNANFNNEAWVALSGTFRDVSNSGGTAVCLPDSVLTAPTGGHLTLYSGTATGFTDGVGNGGTGTPSQLLFTHMASTRNELNGGQMVLDVDLMEFQHLDLGATLKSGLYDNFAQGTIVESYSESNNGLANYVRRFSASCHHAAFLGGVDVSATYHVTDEVSLCIGYEFRYLTNLALGPEQINGLKNNWYHVQTDGTAFIQAIHSGVQIAF